MSKAAIKRKKRKAAAFAVAKLLKLCGATLLIVTSFSLIIASVAFFSFIDTKKSDEYIVKFRSQPQTKAVTVKNGDSDIIKKGYFPISTLNGVVGVKVVGDTKGITISNPSGTEVLEVVPDSNIIIVNGVWKNVEEVVLYSKGECYLPMDLLNKYTCLSVSYDEKDTMYTVSLAGEKDISFFPKNSGNDTQPKKLEIQK
jgi:lipoprotein-anchoring transpeptidase ErfK/SrfK